MICCLSIVFSPPRLFSSLPSYTSSTSRLITFTHLQHLLAGLYHYIIHFVKLHVNTGKIETTWIHHFATVRAFRRRESG